MCNEKKVWTNSGGKLAAWVSTQAIAIAITFPLTMEWSVAVTAIVFSAVATLPVWIMMGGIKK